MTAITLSAFRQRYTEFNCVVDAEIEPLIAESSLFVTDGWGDYQELGGGLYIAHHLSIAGYGTGTAANAVSNAGIRSRTSGSHRIEYFDTSSNDANGEGFSATSYGVRFERLLKAFSQSFKAYL